MRLLLILSACFLVGCGNDYGIEEGKYVTVHLGTSVKQRVQGKLYKVTKEMVILESPNNRKTAIPRSKIQYISQMELWTHEYSLKEMIRT